MTILRSSAIGEKRRLFLLGVAAACAVPSAARASPLPISGAWDGRYYYGESNFVPFTAALQVTRRGFAGKTREPNTFGDPAATELKADLAGQFEPGRVVAFVKTYDGTGNVAHAVRYRGVLNSAGDHIKGHWSLSGQPDGAFWMQRRTALLF